MTREELYSYIQNSILLGRIYNFNDIPEKYKERHSSTFAEYFDGSVEYNNMYFKINEDNKIVLTLCLDTYKYVDLGDCVDIIEPYAFCEHTNLIGLKSESVTEIGSGAFLRSSIKYATLDSLREISTGAFYNSDLIEISAPKLEVVNEEGFYACSGLSKINAPSISYIGRDAFAYCSNLNPEFTKNLPTYE